MINPLRFLNQPERRILAESTHDDDAFIEDLTWLFRARMNDGNSHRHLHFADRVYGSITQKIWTHLVKGQSGFGYREAESVIDAVSGITGYLSDDPYVSEVDAGIAAELHDLGWHWDESPWPEHAFRHKWLTLPRRRL